MEGFIFDLKHDEGNRIKLLLKNSSEKVVYDEIDPYFYVVLNKESDKKKIDKFKGVKKTEFVKKIDRNKEIKLLKVCFEDMNAFSHAREKFMEFGRKREHDFPLQFKYLFDKEIYPLTMYDFSVEGEKLKKITKQAKKGKIDLKIMSFDIETYNKEGISDPLKHDIIIIGVYDGKTFKSLNWRKNQGSEEKMLLDFKKYIKEKNPDIITGYNSGGFDFPYLSKRMNGAKIETDIGRDGEYLRVHRGGINSTAKMFGRMHLDTYDSISFLTAIGAMRLPKNDLESVYKELFGEEKLDIDVTKMWQMWERGGKDFELVKQYNKEDTTAAYKIAEEVLPLYIELSKIVGVPLYDASRMSTSQLIEWLLIREAHKQGIISPRRPEEKEVRERIKMPIKGAFVKLPEAGLHEHIAICDYRSLYPSLIVTYNLDGNALDCNCCKTPFISPDGHKFCKKKIGLMPTVMKRLIETRTKVKTEMKKCKKGTPKYRALHFKQWALKILANSGYGYLNYARARWYSRHAAESITGLARQFIRNSIKKAELEGFEVLYADTDSLFLNLKSKSEVEKVKDFVRGVNKELPGDMELEFEGYYPRGIFVSRRGEKVAAKKRYALIREDGTLEITGFEFVRRDWSNIAKQTQEKVIQAVLKEGKPQKAVNIVKKTIEKVRKGDIDLDDVVILTRITRKPSSYEQQAPHVVAAKKLIKNGYKVTAGTLIEYVVIRGSGKISERAIPIQLLEKRGYDPEYYIEHQILPSVMKILAELGVKEEDLKYKGKQSGLSKWV